MKFLLTVLFFNIAGEVQMIDGWYPIVIEGAERCEKGAENIREYLELIDVLEQLNDITEYSVECIPIKGQSI